MGDDARGDEARRGRHPDHDRCCRRRPRDRIERGAARHVVCRAPDGEVRRVPGRLHADRGRRAADGWLDYRGRRTTSAAVSCSRQPSTGHLLLYFTSGTTARPEARRAHPRLLPGGPPVDHVLARAAARRRSPQISSPGWAKHAWSQLLRAVAGRGDGLRPQLHALRRRALLGSAPAASTTSAPRPPCGGCSSRPTFERGRPACARSSARASRSTRRSSSGSRRVGARPSATASARPRPPLQIGNTPGQPVKPGSMGRPLPGYRVVLVDPVTDASRPGWTRARSAST